MIQFNPVDTSNQIKQYGGYIQGIRPGKPTAQYLINTYNNLNMADAMYMLLICAVPMFEYYSGFGRNMVSGHRMCNDSRSGYREFNHSQQRNQDS